MLCNPLMHKEPGSNYVTDCLKLANVQLLYSGTCFGFDPSGMQYVLEENDMLHERKRGDGNAQQTVDVVSG